MLGLRTEQRMYAGLLVDECSLIARAGARGCGISLYPPAFQLQDNKIPMQPEVNG